MKTQTHTLGHTRYTDGHHTHTHTNRTQRGRRIRAHTQTHAHKGEGTYTHTHRHRPTHTQRDRHRTHGTDIRIHTHTHALTAKSSLSWPPQQSDGGVKFVPCIWWTSIQYSTGYRSIAETALVPIQVARLKIKQLSCSQRRWVRQRTDLAPAKVGEPSYPLKLL